MFRLVIIACLFSACAFAQCGSLAINPTTGQLDCAGGNISGSGVPSNTLCTRAGLGYVNNANGDFYTCPSSGGSWVKVSAGSAPATFAQITAGTNTGNALVVGNGSTLSYTGTGTINAGLIIARAITAFSGNASILATSTGVLTSGHLASWDASGNAIDSGVVAANVLTGNQTITLSGDVSGTGTTSITVTTTKLNGTTVSTNAAADQLLRTTASAVGSWASIPICTDTGGNHLNYDTATHTFSCGTSGGGSGSTSWSGITNPTTNLTLSMGTNNTEFDNTNAATWKYANTTVATSGASQSSPLLNLCGTEWHAAASTSGCFTMQFIPGTGTDAASTIAFTHVGSATGAVTSTFPGPIQAGGTAGAAGAIAFPQGTDVTAVSGQVGIEAPASVTTAFNFQLPGAPAAGFVRATNATPSVVSVSPIVQADLPTTTIAQKFFGTAAPGSVAGNLPGDLYTDTTNHNEYVCNAPSGTAAPACTSVTTAGWLQVNGGGGSGITQLTGDVTAGPGSGSQTATLANIPTGVTMAGYINSMSITTPVTPAAGKMNVYTLGGSKVLAAVDEAGTVTHTVQSYTGNTNHFVTAIADNGVISHAQPTLTGDVTGLTSATVVANINGTSVPTNAAADQFLGTTASATAAWASIANCLDSGGNHLNYNTTTHAFSCGTTSSGGLSGGTTGALTDWTSSSAVGSVSGTVVLNGGTNVIAGALAANTRILIAANVTQNTSAISVTQANVTIECASPDITISQATASTNLFTVTGNFFSIKNCGLNPPASGTAGQLVTVNANDSDFDNITLNANSSTSTNGGNGWLQITGGTGHRVRNWKALASADTVIKVDSTSAAIHKVSITDGKAAMTGGDSKWLVQVNSETGNNVDQIFISRNDIQTNGGCMTTNTQGSGVLIELAHIVGNRCMQTANNATEGYSFFGCNKCVVDGNIFDDQGFGHGGAFTTYFSVHDASETRVVNNIAITCGGAGLPYSFLDTRASVISHNYAGPKLDPSTGLIACSFGFGASSNGINVETSAAAADESNNIISENQLILPASYSGIAIAILGDASAGTGRVNNTQITGNHIIGTNAGTGIKFVQSTSSIADAKVSGNFITKVATGILTSGTITGLYIAGNYFDTVTTGISIASGASGTKIGEQYFTGVTTEYSDAGTNTHFSPQCHIYTLSVATTNFTVTQDGGPVTNTAVAAATTQSVTLFALCPLCVVTGLTVKSGTAWTATGLTSLTATVGDSVGGTTTYTSSTYDMRAAVSNTNFLDASLFKHASQAGSNVQASLIANQNLNANQLAGSTDFRVCWAAQ